MIQTGLRSFVGNGSSSQDFVGAAKIILRSSSLETGENDVSGSPSNFISAHMVSQLSLDELFVAAKLSWMVLIFPTKNSQNLSARAFSSCICILIL